MLRDIHAVNCPVAVVSTMWLNLLRALMASLSTTVVFLWYMEKELVPLHGLIERSRAMTFYVGF
jgi:hypothetical protein